MKPYVSEFERGRKIVLVLLVLAIAFSVVALCSAENSSQQVIFIFAAFTCMAGLIVASHMAKHDSGGRMRWIGRN